VCEYCTSTTEVFSGVGRSTQPVGEAPGSEQSRVPEFTAALVLGDDALAPESVASEGQVAWADIAPESKQLTLAPTEDAPERDR
jgi:hypothetical protein